MTILLKAIGLTPEAILANFFVFDNFRLMDTRRADGVRRRAPARRSRALRHHRQVGQGRSSTKDKRITARHMRDIEAVGHQAHLGAGRLPGRPRAGAQHRRRRHRRDHRQGQRRADRDAAEEAARRRRQGHPGALHQRARPGRATSRRRCASTRPPTSWPRASPSTA